MADTSLLQNLGQNIGLPKQISLPGDAVLNVSQLNKTATAAIGQSTDFVLNTVLALLLVAGTWIFTRWLARWLQEGLVRARVEETFAAFVSSILMYLLFLFAVVAALRLVGVSNTSLVTVLGASALAVGFALRGTLTHVASGLMLITNRPFRIGDWIQLDALEGRVRRITLFNTEVATLDNKRVFIPNTRLWEGTLINHTYSRERMVEVILRAGYDVAPEEVKRLVLETLKAEDRVLPRPEPMVGLKQMPPEGAEYLVRAWVRTGDYAAMRYEIPLKLWQAMRKAKYAVPAQPWAGNQEETKA